MDLKQLAYFVAVADAGSFSRAARSINIKQATLSRHILEIEKRLGMALFDRKTQQFMDIATEHEAGAVNALSFSADGRWLGFTRERGVAGLADLGKG